MDEEDDTYYDWLDWRSGGSREWDFPEGDR